MKIRTTQKAIRESYSTILQISYCGAQALFWGTSPFAYNSGVYGWNCDYYEVWGVAICTGYRPHGKPVNYDRLARYEKEAQRILDSRIISYDDKILTIRGLRKMWLEEETAQNLGDFTSPEAFCEMD